MAKYLHRYKSLEDFKKDYYGSAPVTAFTVTGGSVSPGCDGRDWTETHDFDGRYVLDGEEVMTMTGACDSSAERMSVRLFRKGDTVLYDPYDDIGKAWNSEEVGNVFYIQDVSQAWQAGDAQLSVSNLEYGEPVYHEPWVSCTTDTRLLSGTADALYGSNGSDKVLLATNITLTLMGRTGFYVNNDWLQ
jgi:hypothetical protein